MGLFDKVCSAETHLAHPGLYATKNNGESFFNIKVRFYINNVKFRNVSVRFKKRWIISKCIYMLKIGILGMDYKCVDSFVAIVLAAANGSETRRSLGEW